jgi:nucleoside 2-deoxyribosyltransferase
MADIETAKLEGACCYLSGPMEFVADHGVEWRRKFVRLVHEAGLGIDFIDPTDKPGGVEVKIGENKEYQSRLKQSGQWHELKRYVRKYRRYDLRFVDLSDFLVVVVDPRVPQWGTANEVYFAESQHKPCFFICDGGLAKLPNWLFDIVELDCPFKNTRCNVFGTVEEVVEELRRYNAGEIPLTDEWVLIRRHIEESRANKVRTPEKSLLEELRAICKVKTDADLLTKINEIINDA